MNRLFRRKCLIYAILIYFIAHVCGYAIFKAFFTSNLPDININLPMMNRVERVGNSKFNIYPKKFVHGNRNNNSHHVVEIWNNAAIGHYLWKHILNYDKQEEDSPEALIHDNIKFLFKTGFTMNFTKHKKDLEYLVLILNGREDHKIYYSQMWLDFVQSDPNLKRLAVVLLGNENCQNYWIMPYLRKNGGFIDILFLVYDDPVIDYETVFQWPLGVATYRNFPKFGMSLSIDSPRPYIFNFVGTVYANSSREQLHDILIHDNSVSKEKGFVKTRSAWVPNETEESLSEYINALQNSDLTLNPSGNNNECYRIYEALSLGSIPIVEDTKTVNSSCDTQSFRILKSFKNSPIIFIKSWTELVVILQNEVKLPQWKKIARRNNAIAWYQNFLASMKMQFIKTIKRAFFH